MADAAHTQLLTRQATRTETNPSADDKLRTEWDRRAFAYDRADRAYQSAERRAERAYDRYKQGKVDEPDIDWKILAVWNRDIDKSLNITRIEKLREQAMAQLRWTFPTPPESRVDIELAKIREYRLKRELLDVKSGYTETSKASDAAFDRRWKAQRDLLLSPAPDLDAVQYKLEYLFGDEQKEGDDDNSTPIWSRDLTDALIADVRRLNQQPKEA